MGDRTVTRAHLTEAVYQEVGLSRNESADLVESVLEKISFTLSGGEGVKISSFGSFGVRMKGERIGRNPKTGEEVTITSRRVVVFRPSHILKNRISSSLGEAATRRDLGHDGGRITVFGCPAVAPGRGEVALRLPHHQRGGQ